MKIIITMLSLLLPASGFAGTRCYVYIEGGRCPGVPSYQWFEDFRSGGNAGICLHRAKDIMAECRLIGVPGAGVVAAFNIDNVGTVNAQKVSAGTSTTYGYGWAPIDTK